jgi:hypothetical protein
MGRKPWSGFGTGAVGRTPIKQEPQSSKNPNQARTPIKRDDIFFVFS